MTRPFVPVALGLLLLSAAVAACSSLSPNPPDPHVIDGDPDLAFLLQDSGADGTAPDGDGGSP